MRLIDGLASAAHRIKLLEYVQSAESPPSLDNCLQFAQQLELIHKFSTPSLGNIHAEAGDVNIAHVDQRSRFTKPCKFCGRRHDRGRCPAYGKTCTKCSKLNHFATVCRSTKSSHTRRQTCKNTRRIAQYTTSAPHKILH